MIWRANLLPHAPYVAFAFWRQDLYIAFDVEFGPFCYGVLGMDMTTVSKYFNIVHSLSHIPHSAYMTFHSPVIFDMIH